MKSLTNRQIKNATLIDKLQKEAKHQARLENKKILSTKLNKLLWFMACYPWQFLLMASFLTTVAFEAVYQLVQSQ